VKVLADNGGGSNSGVVAGINWVAGEAKKTTRKSIANLSLGSSYSASTNSATKSAFQAGVTMVVAAGNDNSDACGYSPASEPTAITVAASDIFNVRASYSNYGNCVDLFGPGSSITSAWIGSPTATNTISGTSMASPQVCGTGAKFLSADSNLTPTSLTAKILNDASANEISNVMGSPNLMAYGYCT
jgi:serine protease